MTCIHASPGMRDDFAPRRDAILQGRWARFGCVHDVLNHNRLVRRFAFTLAYSTSSATLAGAAECVRGSTDRCKSRVTRIQARMYLQSASRKNARTCSGDSFNEWKAVLRLARICAFVLLTC